MPHLSVGEKTLLDGRYSCSIPVLKSFAPLLPGRATPVAKAAGKPFQQVLQVGEAAQRTASPTHWLNFSLYGWGTFILHPSLSNLIED
ncbi:MAG: hypothetical protein ACHBN1_12640 [Heteroscytonema crispum UTEX LB 1556]